MEDFSGGGGSTTFSQGEPKGSVVTNKSDCRLRECLCKSGPVDFA